MWRRECCLCCCRSGGIFGERAYWPESCERQMRNTMNRLLGSIEVILSFRANNIGESHSRGREGSFVASEKSGPSCPLPLLSSIFFENVEQEKYLTYTPSLVMVMGSVRFLSTRGCQSHLVDGESPRARAGKYNLDGGGSPRLSHRQHARVPDCSDTAPSSALLQLTTRDPRRRLRPRGVHGELDP